MRIFGRLFVLVCSLVLVLSSNASARHNPINGSCGASNGAMLSNKPTTGLCGTGAVSPVSGTGPWTWSCAGSNGGTTASCDALLASSIGITAPPVRTADFINTLGVNTHLDQGDTYANTANVIANLHYLGVANIREGIAAPIAGSSFVAVAQAGMKYTVVPFVGGNLKTVNLTSGIALIDQLNEAVPGSVIAVEGPNEINNWPVTYNGVSRLKGAVSLQKALYAAVHADAHLSGVAVDYFTSYQDVTGGPGPDPATTAGLAR